MTETLQSALHKHFGYSEFRPLQESIIHSLLAGQNAFVLMPTGGGKSLCYQLPAAVSEGMTLVVSPLIALMKDQVDQLNAAGIPATFLNSTLGPQEMDRRMHDALQGKYKLLYVAPERLVSGSFLSFLDRIQLSLVAVDEAHCISEWGHDFRAEYRRLSLIKERWPNVPLIAMTATATARVQEDIIKQLHLRDVKTFRASFNRPNLHYRVLPKRKQFDDLVTFLKAHKSECGIVYCLSRDGTEQLAKALQQQGFRAIPYHAGLEREMRTRNQEKFSRDEVEIVCATIAFGMGINKSNVRYVVHYDLPKNLAGYYQETGRAGRDGLDAECLLFFSLSDKVKLMRFIDDISDEGERIHARKELDLMVGFAQAEDCRRAKLLAYFGESLTERPCSGCDNCSDPSTQKKYDVTRQAQMFLSCMLRVNQKFGGGHVIAILRGSENQRVQDWRHDKLPTYGIGKDYSLTEWKWIGSELQRLGYILQDHEQYSVLRVTAAGITALKERHVIEINRPVKGDGVRVRAGIAEVGAIHEELFQRLRAIRKEIAEREDVAPYVIFHDKVLRNIAAALPLELAALLDISGVGDIKARRYGEKVLLAVKQYTDEHAGAIGLTPDRNSIPHLR
jgi:ATP-dependent DNA helicase RecQ